MTVTGAVELDGNQAVSAEMLTGTAERFWVALRIVSE